MQLSYGSNEAFDALVYGEKHPGTVDYLRNQIHSAASALTDAGRSFFDRARASFEHFNGNAAMNFARTAIQTILGGDVTTQRVVYLSELVPLQNANQLMQRYLMANPVVRERWFDQRVDGYSETYVNVNGADIGAQDYDYRRVMDGFMQITDDGRMKFTQYIEELREGDRHLSLFEKVDIVDSWSAQNVLLALGEDPTDPGGGKL